MQPVARDTMYGMYEGDGVMIVGLDNFDHHTSTADALCEIEYYHPVASERVGTRKIVPFRELQHLNGPGVVRRS